MLFCVVEHSAVRVLERNMSSPCPKSESIDRNRHLMGLLSLQAAAAIALAHARNFLSRTPSVCLQITTDAGSSHSRTHSLTEAEVYADDMAVSYAQQDTQLVSLLVLLASTSADVRARRVLAAENGMQGHPPVQDWYCQCSMPVHRI